MRQADTRNARMKAAVQQGNLYRMDRIISAGSEYEIFSFPERRVYRESARPARLRVLSENGVVIVTCEIFDRATVIDHWRAVMHAACPERLEDPGELRFPLPAFAGARVGGVPLEYRPDVAVRRYLCAKFAYPEGPGDPAPWHPDQGTPAPDTGLEPDR